MFSCELCCTIVPLVNKKYQKHCKLDVCSAFIYHINAITVLLSTLNKNIKYYHFILVCFRSLIDSPTVSHETLRLISISCTINYKYYNIFTLI